MTTKPGMSGTSTGVFSKVSQSASARARVVLARGRGEDQLDELHLRDGVEHVQAEERSGRPVACGEALDRERGGGARQDRVGVEDRVEFASSPAFTSWSSTTASTTKVASASAPGSVTISTCSGSTSAPSRASVSRRWPAPARLSSPSGRAEHRAVVGGGGGQAARDGAAACDLRAFAPWAIAPWGLRPVWSGEAG